MKCKLSLLFLLVTVVLVGYSAETDSAKSREKRSPQFGKFLGSLIGRWIPKVIKEGEKIYKLIRKNPGAAAAAGGAAVGVGVGIGSHAQQGKKFCAVHIRRDLPELQPVFIKDGTPRSLMVPNDGYLTWAHGETSTIACPSSQNFIVATNTMVETITCDNGLMFHLNGRLVNINTITCNTKVTGNYQIKPYADCVGTNKAIGFNVPFPTGDMFFDLFYSCFDETNAIPLYTHHVLKGNEIEHKCIYRSDRPSFKAAGYTNGFFITSAYTQSSQKARLAELFGVGIGNSNAVSEADRYYSQSSLQRGHLTPDADELFTTWQWSTYFYINVAGMWEQINTGNWKALEAKVRTAASESKKDFEIYTGTYGTLRLCTTSNYCPDFTLVNGGVPVPEWLWKIVKIPSEDAAIALVVSNNPFKRVAPICGSQQNYGWHQVEFDNYQYGAVSYCTVQELKQVVRYIPNEALATLVLWL